ncbi:MAG: cytochrome c [Verrucomicrobia bacterium]|nr:cytochrome c [Verrucomicrobiota bacterium]
MNKSQAYFAVIVTLLLIALIALLGAGVWVQPVQVQDTQRVPQTQSWWSGVRQFLLPEARYPQLSADEIARRSELLLALQSDAEALAHGARLHKNYCAACHGADVPTYGTALTAVELWQTVHWGDASRGMPPWGGLLSAADLDAVSAFWMHHRNP